MTDRLGEQTNSADVVDAMTVASGDAPVSSEGRSVLS